MWRLTGSWTAEASFSSYVSDLSRVKIFLLSKFPGKKAKFQLIEFTEKHLKIRSFLILAAKNRNININFLTVTTNTS